MFRHVFAIGGGLAIAACGILPLRAATAAGTQISYEIHITAGPGVTVAGILIAIVAGLVGLGRIHRGLAYAIVAVATVTAIRTTMAAANRPLDLGIPGLTATPLPDTESGVTVMMFAGIAGILAWFLAERAARLRAGRGSAS